MASACTRVHLPLKRWGGAPRPLRRRGSWRDLHRGASAVAWRGTYSFRGMNTDADPIHRILVVDDNPAIHDDFRKILSPRSAVTQQLGTAAAKLFDRPSCRTDSLRFEIDCASRGQEGIDKVRAAVGEGRPYSMAYVDVRMPNGWDGIETISRIWQEQADLLVVICTAFSDHSLEEIQERLGCSDRFLILKKPFDNLAVRQLTWALVERARSERELHVSQQALQMRTLNLEQVNSELKQRSADLQEARDVLDQRVQERTAEFLVLNQELEAFSNSLAHDLRSPLTVINGYSDLLLQECRGKVSQTVMNHLQLINDGAVRMSELIKDLLRLARANSTEMVPRQINLSELSASILDSIQATQPERRIEFVGTPEIVSIGDLGLLRIALENLLGNAWKYTCKTKHARIEFGVEQQSGMSVFFVRDNGAGFDMASAGKLFSPFFRLHSGSEFAGTGVGLSTVKRIIARHRGLIWAEAAVGKGATFFFTLGEGYQTNVA
jgi:two-component system NtrC family sensor kinase